MTRTSFVARDPVSYRRFSEATGIIGTVSADLAFLLEPQIATAAAKDAHDWAFRHRAAGGTVLGVNASGHTLELMDGDGIGAYAAICRNWLATNSSRAILLVPHDVRPAPVGDVEALTKIAKLLGDFGDRVHLLASGFSAWDIKAICGQLDLVLTGRMHFAIAGLGMGVPALNISYVGKFDGLMQHCGLEDQDLIINPAEVLNVPQISQRLESLTEKVGGLRGHLSKKLPLIQALSKKNFAWINADKMGG